MKLTQKMVKKLEIWEKEKTENNFLVCFLPKAFDDLETSKYLEPISDIEIVKKLLGLDGDVYIVVSNTTWSTEIKSDNDNFNVKIIDAIQEYYRKIINMYENKKQLLEVL